MEHNLSAYNFTRIPGKFTSWKSLSGIEKKLFFRALGYAILIKPMVSFLPMRWYARWLGKVNRQTPERANCRSLDNTLRQVSKAIKRSGRYLPWKNKCMVEAIIAQKMLKTLGHDTTIYFGVAKDDTKKLKAHAWLRCGNTIVTGKKGMNKFTVVSCFS